MEEKILNRVYGILRHAHRDKSVFLRPVGPGEKSDSSREVQFGMGTGAVVESLSICLPVFDDERGFFAHAVCAVNIHIFLKG